MQLALTQSTQCLVLNAKNLEIQSVRLSRQEVDTEDRRQEVDTEDRRQEVGSGTEDTRQDGPAGSEGLDKDLDESEAGGSGLVKDHHSEESVELEAPVRATRRRPGPASRTKSCKIEEKISPANVIPSDSEGEVVKDDDGVGSSDELKDSIKSGRKGKRRSFKDEDSKPVQVVRSDSEVEVTEDTDGAECSQQLKDASKAVRKSKRKSFKAEEMRPVKVIKSDSDSEVVEVDDDEDMAQLDGCDSVLEEDWAVVTTRQVEVAVSR